MCLFVRAVCRYVQAKHIAHVDFVYHFKCNGNIVIKQNDDDRTTGVAVVAGIAYSSSEHLMENPWHFHSIVTHAHWQTPHIGYIPPMTMTTSAERGTKGERERDRLDDKYFLLIFSSAINSSSSPSCHCRTDTHAHTRLASVYLQLERDLYNLWHIFCRFVCMRCYRCEHFRTLNAEVLSRRYWHVRCACLPISRKLITLNIGYHFICFSGRPTATTTRLCCGRCAVLPFFASSNRCCPKIVNNCDMWLNCNPE